MSQLQLKRSYAMGRLCCFTILSPRCLYLHSTLGVYNLGVCPVRTRRVAGFVRPFVGYLGHRKRTGLRLCTLPRSIDSLYYCHFSIELKRSETDTHGSRMSRRTD